MTPAAETVEIVEVGPRDGLQNEAAPISVQQKIALVDALSEAGFARIEVASFVSPKWVPQMAGSAEVLRGITRARGTRYAALTPNVRGLEDAIAAGADEVAVFASASEGFSRANINAGIDESFARFAPLMARAAEVGIPVRGYVSCIVDCPYDGKVAPREVARVAERLHQMGCYEISLGDTLGQAKPAEIHQMLRAVMDVLPADILAGHYHDTAGFALDNVASSLEQGLRVFDAAIGGLGGCPYAPGAAGNVATERLAKFLESHGFATGLNLVKVESVAQSALALRQTREQ